MYEYLTQKYAVHVLKFFHDEYCKSGYLFFMSIFKWYTADMKIFAPVLFFGPFALIVIKFKIGQIPMSQIIYL